MRTLQNLWDTFCNRFSNAPMQFTDEITPDGLATAWELTFYPICDLASKEPTVIQNQGTLLAPTWVPLTKNTHYFLDYETGQISFPSAPPSMQNDEWENVVTIKVVAHHMKINLRQFRQFWNEITGQMEIFWPLTRFEEVQNTDIGLPSTTTSVSEIDLTHTFWEGKIIKEIFQDKSDAKHILFDIKAKTLLIHSQKNTPRRTINWGPTDYDRTHAWILRGTLSFPFWLSYHEKYPIFNSADPNTDLVEDTKLSLSDSSELNATLRIGLSMYTMREHWSERINASTLRMSTSKDIQMAKQSVSMDIMRHTWDNAPGRGNTPPTTFWN